MSSSAPSDLAVTFRSLPRRLREATEDLPAGLVGEHGLAIDQAVAEAAALLHCAADPMTVALGIEAVPADEWDPATLDGLRALALELGRRLRAIAAANPDR